MAAARSCNLRNDLVVKVPAGVGGTVVLTTLTSRVRLGVSETAAAAAVSGIAAGMVGSQYRSRRVGWIAFCYSSIACVCPRIVYSDVERFLTGSGRNYGIISAITMDYGVFFYRIVELPFCDLLIVAMKFRGELLVLLAGIVRTLGATLCACVLTYRFFVSDFLGVNVPVYEDWYAVYKAVHLQFCPPGCWVICSLCDNEAEEDEREIHFEPSIRHHYGRIPPVRVQFAR